MSKVLTKYEGGKVIAEIEGLQVIAFKQPAKTKRGKKDRISFRLDQTDPARPWRIGRALVYHGAVDVMFERQRTGA